MNPEISEIKSKLRSLLDSPGEDSFFVHYLSAYSHRAEEILHGPVARMEPSRRDLIAELSRFSSDQKAIDWANEKGITLSKKEFWWWFNPENRTGRITGLHPNESGNDNSWGTPRITNGIDVYIEHTDGTIFKGHRDWLKFDKRPKGIVERNGKQVVVESIKPVERFLKSAKDILAKKSEQFFYAKCLTEGIEIPTSVITGPTTAETLSFYIEKYINKITIKAEL